MTDPKTSLRVAISGDLADIKSALVGLNSKLEQTGKTGARAGAEASKGLAGIEGAAGRLRSKLGALGAGLTVGALFTGILSNTRESEAAIAQLNASLKSTGGIAGVTAEEISSLADSLAATTTFGDDAIVSMASVLATFTNIRTTVFKDAIPAILDLSAKLGGDLQSSAIQVGKALNDPIKGLTALGKIGVAFTADQKKLIESLVKTGDVAGAQRVILKELSTEMGGSAAAAADTLGGAIDQAKNAFGNLLEGDSSSGGLKDTKTAFQELTRTLNDPDVKNGFAAMISGLGQVVTFAANAIAAVNGMRQAVVDALAIDTKKSDLGLLAKRAALEDDLYNVSNSGAGRLNLYGGGRSGEVNAFSIMIGGAYEQAQKLRAEIVAVDALLSQRRLLADKSKVNTAAQINAGGPVEFIDPPSGPQGFQADPLIDEDALARAAAEAKRKLEALRKERERLLAESKKADAAHVKDLLDQEAKVSAAMVDIGNALKRAEGDEAGAAFAEIRLKYAQLIEDLKKSGKPGDIGLVERLIDLEQVDAQLAIFKSKLQEASSASQATISSLSGQAAGGLITGTEADRGRADALSKELVLQQQLLATAQRYLGTLSADSPEATKTLAFIEQLKGRIGDVQATQNQFKQQVHDLAVSSFANFFTDLATGVKSFKDAFKDMLRSFLSGIAQMIAQKMALKAVDAIFAMFHSGGIVGMGGSLRSGINPMVFGLAPRYHSGGIAGLAPNEVGAILQKGEEVLTRNDPRHRQNAGAGGAVRGIKNVFVFDANVVADHMVSAPGEQAFLHLLGRNSGAIREILS